MAIGEERLLDLVRRLVSSDLEVREDACGTVTDWIGSFAAHEVRLISNLLATLSVIETNDTCRESELHAVFELFDTGFITPNEVEALRRIDPSSLRGSEVEYMDYLLSELWPT